MIKQVKELIKRIENLELSLAHQAKYVERMQADLNKLRELLQDD